MAGAHALSVVEAEARRVGAGLAAARAEVLDYAVGDGDVGDVRRVLRPLLQVHLRGRALFRASRDGRTDLGGSIVALEIGLEWWWRRCEQ